MKSTINPSQIDSAFDYISELQKLKKQLYKSSEGLELGLLQQFLDDSSLYIKQIPRVTLILYF
jgi:hypothetical protein